MRRLPSADLAAPLGLAIPARAGALALSVASLRAVARRDPGDSTLENASHFLERYGDLLLFISLLFVIAGLLAVFPPLVPVLAGSVAETATVLSVENAITGAVGFGGLGIFANESADAAGQSSGESSPPRDSREYARHVDNGDGILAELGDDGVIDFYIKRGPNTPPGSQMFDEMMQHYGKSVRGIRGTWLGNGQLASNYNAFQAGLKSGLGPEQAASQTFTGRMAARYGFRSVRVVSEIPGRVIVEFLP